MVKTWICKFCQFETIIPETVVLYVTSLKKQLRTCIMQMWTLLTPNRYIHVHVPSVIQDHLHVTHTPSPGNSLSGMSLRYRYTKSLKFLRAHLKQDLVEEDIRAVLESLHVYSPLSNFPQQEVSTSLIDRDFPSMYSFSTLDSYALPLFNTPLRILSGKSMSVRGWSKIVQCMCHKTVDTWIPNS